MKTNDPQILYTETQRFTHPWIWLVVLGVTIVAWGSIITILFIDPPDSESTVKIIMLLLVFILTGIGLPLLLFVMKLTVTIYTDRLAIRFPPFIRRDINFDEIKSAQARTYHPIREYGGWGIRYGLKHGKAYNVKGNEGVQLVLKDGKKLLIGSQSAEEFEAMFKKAIKG